MGKLLKSLEEAIRACELEDGMRVAFHHHLREGDGVTAMVLKEIARLGIKNIAVSSSGLQDGITRQGLAPLVEDEVVTRLDVAGAGSIYGGLVSRGKFKDVAHYYTHGGRPYMMETGRWTVDVAFIAASASDEYGNCNGMQGKSAFGSIGFAIPEAEYAKKVVVVTDQLFPYPLERASIDEHHVDYVVCVDSIGDVDGIMQGIARPRQDPVSTRLGEYAAQVIEHSGLLKDGMNYQAGGSSPSIQATKNVEALMRKYHVTGASMLGAMSDYSVELVENGLFRCLLNGQTIGPKAIRHLYEHPLVHREVSCSAYASPTPRGCLADHLDVVTLGALQVDTDFNCNVHLNSMGYFTGGAGGHGDIAETSKLAIIVVPLTRTRIPTIVDKVLCLSTPGKNINVVVTQYGVAVNPLFPELEQRLKDGGVNLKNIHDLKQMAEDYGGKPAPVHFGDKVVAKVYHRDGSLLQDVYNVVED